MKIVLPEKIALLWHPHVDVPWSLVVTSPYVGCRVGVDYKSPITITITVPIKLSITITVVIEKAIMITITIIRLRLQLLVYHGNDSRLFIRHVHLQYYHYHA